MTSIHSFSTFAARLRDFIQDHARCARKSGSPLSHQDGNFNRLALDLFALQFTHNPFYRRLCGARDASPDSIQRWQDIPAVPAAAFKDFDVTSLPPEQRCRVFQSSGTTNQSPSRHFHDAESLAIYEASLLPWFESHLLDSSAIPTNQMHCISLTPPASGVPNSSLVHMFETIRNHFAWRKSAFTGQVGPDGAWTADLEKTLAALDDAIATDSPALLLGTAFNFVHLLDHLMAANRRLRLPDGSRVMETGGYKGRSRALPKTELHSLITQWLGIAPECIICEYGMSELSSQAYDRSFEDSPATDRIFRFPPWARAQIISPEIGREVAEGETGLIRIFDLANVRSVMAIQTEDLGVRPGDGFELLGRAALAEPRGCSLMAI